MDQEILSIIEKNLPAQVGKTLQKRLALVEEYEEVIVELKEALKESEEQNARLLKEKATWGDIDVREEQLTVREDEVTARENKMELVELKKTCADEKVHLMQGLVETVFRSPVYKRQINDSRFISNQYANGQDVPMETGRETRETVTEE